MLSGTFLVLFWKSKCVSQIFSLTKGWLALETSSSETLYGGQFTTWYQQVLTKLVGKCLLETCYGGQFTTSLQLIKLNYLVIPSAMQHHNFFQNLFLSFICLKHNWQPCKCTRSKALNPKITFFNNDNKINIE